VVAGLNAFAEGHPKEKRPLAAGFVTFGSDSGHSNAADGKPMFSQNLQGGPGQNGQLVVPGQGFRMNASFAQSKEAMANFGGDQLKQTHDVAMEIIKKRYGRAPEKMYFSGHSQGGHEAVLVTQRFGKDYDGVFAGAPVLDVTAVQTVYILNIQQMYQSHDTWLDEKKIDLVAKAELDQCDGLDGIKDGVIGNWKACKFDATTLRCPEGKDGGDTCLSDGQAATVNALHGETRFPFPLAAGVKTHPGWPLGNELDPNEGWEPVLMNGEPPSDPKGHNADLGFAWLKGAIANDPSADWRAFSLEKYADRIQYLSKTGDSLNPDVSEFCGHGGKLMIWVGMSDFRITPYVGINWYKSVVAKIGQEAADRCIAIYASPGLSHIRSSYNNEPNMFAFFQPMQDWVEKGITPGDLVGERLDPKSPGTVLKSVPLCKNLKWPKYNGSGDPNVASSYTCVP
jgi:Tannase and feruloyl esterase